MDDNFLYQNRPPVQTGFGESLYSRISNLPLQRGRTVNTLRFALRFAIVSMILFTVLFSFSQPVRASVLDWIKRIAGFEVQETDTVSTEGSVIIQPTVSGPMDEILNDLPYEITLPSYVPKGFIFENKVDVNSESVFMTWWNSVGDQILLQIDTEHEQRYLTGIDAAQDIRINGEPAMLIQGGYLDDNWDHTLPTLNIIQRKGDLIYWLIYVQKYSEPFDNVLWRDELIHMMSTIE